MIWHELLKIIFSNVLHMFLQEGMKDQDQTWIKYQNDSYLSYLIIISEPLYDNQ